MTTVRVWGGDVHLSGLFLFVAFTALMAALKLTVFEDWSWWRVSLPLFVFVGFNAAYIICGFIYLSVATLPEETEEEPPGLDGVDSSHRWISMLFFVAFADNAVRWIEGTEDSYWFWLLSGTGGAVMVFASLSVLTMLFYWSRVGRALREFNEAP